MYMLLNNGDHPVYTQGSSSKEYFIKMKNFKWKCVNKVSHMGMNLLHRLLEKDPAKRYTVDKCLRHPWITRKKYDKIPVTYMETWKISLLKNKFREFVSGVVFLLGYQKIMAGKSTKPVIPNSYINLVNKISHELRLKYMLKRDKYFEVVSDEEKIASNKNLQTIHVVDTEMSEKQAIDKYDKIQLHHKQGDLLRKDLSRKTYKLKFDKVELATPMSKKTLMVVHSPQIKLSRQFGGRGSDNISPPTSLKLYNNTKYSEASTECSPLKTKEDSKVKHILPKTRTQEILTTRLSISIKPSVSPIDRYFYN
jgi:serine/threonine protein kinase